MAIEYDYNQEDNMVFFSPVGVLEADAVKDYFTRLLNSETIQNGFIEVVDLAGVDDFRIDFSDCIELSKLFKKLKIEKKYCGAVVYAESSMVKSIAKLLLSVLKLSGIANIIIVNDRNKITSAIENIRA